VHNCSVHFWQVSSSETSRTVLGPIQPPIQWVPVALYLRVKRPGCEADHSPPSSAEVKQCVELCLYSPNTPSWRGARLKAQGQLYLYLYLSFLNQETEWYQRNLSHSVRFNFLIFLSLVADISSKLFQSQLPCFTLSVIIFTISKGNELHVTNQRINDLVFHYLILVTRI
jgi:hypothetical protein